MNYKDGNRADGNVEVAGLFIHTYPLKYFSPPKCHRLQVEALRGLPLLRVTGGDAVKLSSPIQYK